MKRRFKMNLARLTGRDGYSDISFMAHTGPNHGDYFSLLPSLLGKRPDYGRLFAYLFRRFGYPNTGWDDYKELVRYYLSTPLDDMILSVHPYVGGGEVSADITFAFLVPQEAGEAIREYERRDIHAHNIRRLDWIAENVAIPEWMPGCVETFVREGWFAQGSTWRDVFSSLSMFSTSTDEGKPTRTWYKWYESMVAQYEQVEQRPPGLRRGPDWNLWSDDDPLKRYVIVAKETFDDLRRPVRVRDCAINAFGPTEYSRRTLKEPPVAGYPSGKLGNAAPKEFSELHTLIMKFGKGDAKRGIKNAIKRLSSSEFGRQPTKRPKEKTTP